MIRFIAALVAVLVLGSVSQACPPSFSLNSYSVPQQQQTGCYSSFQQFKAYVAPAPVVVPSYYYVPAQAQTYTPPVQQFQSYGYSSAVRLKLKAVPVRAKANFYGAQPLGVGAPQVIQQSTVERKGIFGLRKNKTTTTTIINP